MENIYKPSDYNATEHFYLEQYFVNYSNYLSLHRDEVPNSKKCLKTEQEKIQELQETHVKDNNKFRKKLNFNYMELEELAGDCSPSVLTCAGEYPASNPMKVAETSKFPTRNLRDGNHQDPHVTKARKEFREMRPTMDLVSKRKNIHNILSFPPMDAAGELEPGQEFIIYIHIFRPFAFKYFNGRNFSERLRFGYEILALGNNTLTDIRNKIVCSSDAGVRVAVQNPNDTSELCNSLENNSSACFFIDGVFYNDFRHRDAYDYSIPIINWAKENNIGTFQSTSMNVQLKNLTPRLGYPYVYIHCGDCEHVMIFSDVKVLQENDHLHSENYPHINRLNRDQNLLCFLCGISFAKWICIDGDRFPQEKVLLCTECCNNYNYLGNEKIGDFKLYPYYEQHAK